MDRTKTILSNEGVTFDEKVLAEVIMKHFLDFRRILNELQRYSVSGTIDVGILSQIGEIRVKDLVTHMKKKEFTNVRKWVVDNMDNDQIHIIRKIYDGLA